MTDVLRFIDQLPPRAFAAILIAAAGLVWLAHEISEHRRHKLAASPSNERGSKTRSHLSSPERTGGETFTSEHPGRERLGIPTTKEPRRR